MMMRTPEEISWIKTPENLTMPKRLKQRLRNMEQTRLDLRRKGKDAAHIENKMRILVDKWITKIATKKKRPKGDGVGSHTYITNVNPVPSASRYAGRVNAKDNNVLRPYQGGMVSPK